MFGCAGCCGCKRGMAWHAAPGILFIAAISAGGHFNIAGLGIIRARKSRHSLHPLCPAARPRPLLRLGFCLFLAVGISSQWHRTTKSKQNRGLPIIGRRLCSRLDDSLAAAGAGKSSKIKQNLSGGRCIASPCPHCSRRRRRRRKLPQRRYIPPRSLPARRRVRQASLCGDAPYSLCGCRRGLSARG